jgi:hypothetical protein
MLISVQGTGKNYLQPDRESMGDALSVVTGELEHCREGETNCRFSTFRAFPSDRIHKVTKNISVHFFIHSSNSCKFDQRISGSF